MRMEVLAFAALVGEDEEVAPIFDVLLEVFDFGGGEVVLGGCDDKEVGLFYFIEVDDVLIESDLDVSFCTL